MIPSLTRYIIMQISNFIILHEKTFVDLFTDEKIQLA